MKSKKQNIQDRNKKIGIMTMHRVVNYGSFLQAYALKKMINNLGYNNVSYIDYEYERDIVESRKKETKHNIFSIFDYNRYLQKIHNIRLKKTYNDSLKKIGVDRKNYSKEIDTLVIGSDEVFNCIQTYPVGYSRGLFGKGYEEKNVISYAASFGYAKVEDLVKYKIDKEIGAFLDKFRSISVRDENSVNIINKITNRNDVEINLDPALVYDFEELVDLAVPVDNYIIVYAYQNRLTKNEEKYIRKLAKKYNKTIIGIGAYQRCADKNIVVSPFELLAYFRKADYVITDTFHGTVFSIKMNTKFCTIIRETNKNKLTSLLRCTHLIDRAVNQLGDIEKLYNKETDYSKCNKYLARETKKTEKYLMENM